jgi:hypothetical protein
MTPLKKRGFNRRAAERAEIFSFRDGPGVQLRDIKVMDSGTSKYGLRDINGWNDFFQWDH